MRTCAYATSAKAAETKWGRTGVLKAASVEDAANPYNLVLFLVAKGISPT